MKKSIKREIRAWLILGAMQLAWILPCTYDCANREPIEEEWIEETEDVIRWRFDDVEEDVYIEEMEVEVVQKAPTMRSLGEFQLTAYCSCQRCSSHWGKLTSTGVIATEGRTVAVDPKVIPYGTILIINGHEYVAEDCGSAIAGNEIDIFMEDHNEALEFGIQYAEVFICH